MNIAELAIKAGLVAEVKEGYVYREGSMHSIKQFAALVIEAYKAEMLAGSGEPEHWVSDSGHGTYYRQSMTAELAELQFGGVKIWQGLYTADQLTAAVLKEREKRTPTMTATPPTEQGFYWCQDLEKWDSPRVVCVDETALEFHKVLDVSRFRWSHRIPAPVIPIAPKGDAAC